MTDCNRCGGYGSIPDPVCVREHDHEYDDVSTCTVTCPACRAVDRGDLYDQLASDPTQT